MCQCRQYPGRCGLLKGFPGWNGTAIATEMNKPGDSKYPGKIKAIEFPDSEALIKSNIPMAPVSPMAALRWPM